MSETLKTIRLKAAAAEFNHTVEHIVDFLKKKGIAIEKDPNLKLPGEAYALLLKEFATDKSIRQEAQQITLSKVKKEEDAHKPEVKSKPAAPKEREREEEEIRIKVSGAADKSTKTKKKEEEEKVVAKKA